MPSNKLMIFNFILFQVLWWLCVLSAKPGWGMAVLCLVVLLTALHLQFIESWHQAAPLLLAAFIGCLFDQLGYRMHWVTFEYHNPSSPYIPLWMMALWLAFASTLNISMRWLQPQPLLAALLGAIFGPLAYKGAEALGALHLPYPTLSLAWTSLEWAMLMPLLLWIRAMFNQRQRRPA